MSTLFLGSCDSADLPNDTKKFLEPYHYLGLLRGTRSFRDDDRSKWRRFRPNAGSEVRKLQRFLVDSGFRSNGIVNGIYGYYTQASTRLFQEYLRTVEGHIDVVPDGIVGSGTWTHVNRWISERKKANWSQFGPQNPSPEYKKWMGLIEANKKHYLQNPHPILDQVKAFQKSSDTRKVNDWDFNQNEPHLIGIRRNQDLSANRRENDDLFVLLINGIVFKFWGSTDPSQSMAGSRRDEAFLVEGQHKYRYGWHKISVEKKVYRALRPYTNGVMVFRDWNDDNALTEADLNKGLDKSPNNTINIHWSGIGTANFSAGCQVIAGKSYINHKGKIIDCSKFASRSYSDLSDTSKKTKGAYNVLCDLLLSFSKPGVDHLLYTLGRESNLGLKNTFGSSYAKDALKILKNP